MAPQSNQTYDAVEIITEPDVDAPKVSRFGRMALIVASALRSLTSWSARIAPTALGSRIARRAITDTP